MGRAYTNALFGGLHQPGRLADAGTHPPIPFSQEKSKAWCGWHLLDSTPAELPGQLQIRKLQAEAVFSCLRVKILQRNFINLK